MTRSEKQQSEKLSEKQRSEKQMEAQSDTTRAHHVASSTVKPKLEKIGDVAVVPLDIQGFEELDLPLKIAVYHFAQAARAGDRITFDQWNRFHLPMVHLLEGIVSVQPALPGDLLARITLFLQRMWLNRGNHDMDSTLKFLPNFSAEELHLAARSAVASGASWAHPHADRLDLWIESLEPAFFDADFQGQMTCREPPPGKDVITASAVNYYQDVTESDVVTFHSEHWLNSTLVRQGDTLVEEIWRAGGDGVAPGRYAGPLSAIVHHIEAALPYLSEQQAAYFRHLTRYFRTGDMADFRDYNRAWVQCDPPVDLIIGFLEQYRDPLGHRGEYEGTVHLADRRRAHLMQTLSSHAAYFEARMPWDPSWSRTQLGSVQANVSNLLTLAGSSSPFGYAGVNLPNESRLREEVGSKSLLIGNIVRQRREVYGDAFLREFSPDESCLERARAHAGQARELTIALHEVIGHASGKVSAELKGEPEDFLREYYATLEEARADLVALWHLFDPKLIELKLISSPKVAEEGLWDAVRNAMITVSRLHEPLAEEDHHRAELLIVQFLIDIKAGISLIQQNGKSFWVVKDARAMRQGVGTLLMEIMRIKATGDYAAIRALVQRYGMKVNPALHKELRARGLALGVPEKLAFLNPEYSLVHNEKGEITDVAVSWPNRFMGEQLKLSGTYASL